LEAGGEAAYAPTDVKRRDDLSKLVKLASERYGKLDVLVNNAGIAPTSLLDDLRVDDWEENDRRQHQRRSVRDRSSVAGFPRQGFGHFVNTASTAGFITKPTMSVYSGTKFAVRAIFEGLRQEAGDKLRVTIISPGFVHTNLADCVRNSELQAQILETMDKMAISPDAIARASAFAIEQPPDVDVGEIVIRPTAQA
jgi:NADP-dependent 3-hydroxy acid dehydrogenase YdfG